MTARPEERSEFDPVAEHGSSPKKPLLRSDKHVGKPVGKAGGKPSAKQSGGLLDKLGKHVGMAMGTDPGKAGNRSPDKGMDKRPGERVLRGARRDDRRPVREERHVHGDRSGHGDRHLREDRPGHEDRQGHRDGSVHDDRHVHGAGPVPGGEPGSAAGPGVRTGKGRNDARGAQGMAPEQPPADPRTAAGHAPGARPGSQPVDAGHALAERMANTTSEDTTPAQRTAPPRGHGHPPHPNHPPHSGPATPSQSRGSGTGSATEAGGHRGVPVLADRAAAAEKRLREAVTCFVDDPRGSVESADALLEEVATVFADALAERRRALRDSWHGGSAVTDTEDLRSSLRDYRDLVDRLLHV